MFDDIIKGKANEHEAPVPPDAWDNIANKKKKRRFAFWWWGSAVLLLGLSTAGYLFFNNKNNGEQVAKIATEQSSRQENKDTKLQEDKMQSPAQQESATADIGTTNAVTTTEDINKKQRNIVERKAKATISISANEPEENNSNIAGNNRKIKKTKGKLTAQQTDASINESIAVNENSKTNIQNPVVAENTKEETSAEENKQPIIAAVTDEKSATTEEEKKTNDNKKTEQPKKENTAAIKRKIKKHWLIEAAAIPLIASSHYNDNIFFSRTLTLNNNRTVYKGRLTNASIEPSVAFSFLLRKELSKKVAIGTGLQYMLLKENINIEGKETNTTVTIVNRLVNGQLMPDTISTVTEGTRTVSAVNSYQLFSIPVFVQYNITNKPQWSLDAVGGFYFNISSNYKNEINRNAAAPLLAPPGTTNKSSAGMDIFAGVRIGKKLNKRLDVFAMPSMRWTLARYGVKNSLLDKNISQTGVGFGVCYKIN